MCNGRVWIRSRVSISKAIGKFRLVVNCMTYRCSTCQNHKHNSLLGPTVCHQEKLMPLMVVFITAQWPAGRVGYLKRSTNLMTLIGQYFLSCFTMKVELMPNQHFNSTVAFTNPIQASPPIHPPFLMFALSACQSTSATFSGSTHRVGDEIPCHNTFWNPAVEHRQPCCGKPSFPWCTCS